MKKEDKKLATNRVATMVGHLNAIKAMIEEDKPCEDILIQLSAVESSINNLGKFVLKNHLNTCVKDAIKNGDEDIIERFNKVVEKFL